MVNHVAVFAATATTGVSFSAVDATLSRLRSLSKTEDFNLKFNIYDLIINVSV